MSLYGALYSGVSGLKGQSTKIAVISDNISNVNTVGYKGGQGIFQTLVTSSGGGTSYSPGGVLGGNRALISQQGLLQATNSPTDIAISGGGFFVVNQVSDGTGQVFYTRAGSFTQDASGNFRNTSGFFLQAWPLDREGRLPGEPGNENTISSANLSSLRTVNVQNLTGVAASTTAVSLGANLKASETVYPGTAVTAGMNSSDTVNSNNKARDIIVPQPTGTLDHLTRDADTLTITTGIGATDFLYGGIARGRSVVDASNGDLATALQTNTQTLDDTALSTPNNPFEIMTTTAGASVIRITTDAAHHLRAGDAVTLAGLTAFNSLTLGQLNTTFTVTTVVDDTHFEVTTTGTASGTGPTTNVDAGATYTPQVFTTTNTDQTVRVRQVAHGLTDGEVVTLSGFTGTVAGLDADDLNGTFVIDYIDADHYTIEEEQ